MNRDNDKNAEHFFFFLHIICVSSRQPLRASLHLCPHSGFFDGPCGLFLSRYAARNSTGLLGRSFTSACMPCNKMGTTAVSRYCRMGSAVTSSLFCVSKAAFSATAAATGSSYPAPAEAGSGFGSGAGASSSMAARGEWIGEDEVKSQRRIRLKRITNHRSARAWRAYRV